MADFDWGAIGSGLQGAVVDVARDFYEDKGKQFVAEDKEFFAELGQLAQECAVKLGQAKLAGDDAKVKEHATNLRTLASTARMQVEERRLQLDEALKVELGNILSGVIAVIGRGLLAALTGAL